MDTGCLQLHGTEIRYAFLKSPDHHWMQVLYTIVPRQAQNIATQIETIENSVLRTWIYVPHVDADYSGVVQARKTFFDAINLTEDTHYIASTAIQGGTGERFSRVSMDVYAVLGLPEGDIRYIHAPDHLCPTHKYGVTFERATVVKLGFTDFLFISGTASIDKNGEIVHPGNIEKQTERTLENISALLIAAGFDKEDLSSFIVYLRDITDYTSTKAIIDQYRENLPAVYVKGSVCRPGWLIEIEATAARAITYPKSSLYFGSNPPCFIGTFSPSVDGERLYVQTTRSFQVIDVASGEPLINKPLFFNHTAANHMQTTRDTAW